MVILSAGSRKQGPHHSNLPTETEGVLEGEALRGGGTSKLRCRGRRGEDKTSTCGILTESSKPSQLLSICPGPLT